MKAAGTAQDLSVTIEMLNLIFLVVTLILYLITPIQYLTSQKESSYAL